MGKLRTQIGRIPVTAATVAFLVWLSGCQGSSPGGNQGPNPPTITSQPANQTVVAGQPATFSIVATGTAPLTYQWTKNGANISGATSASYTTPATTTADNNSSFQVTVSNAAASILSAKVTLTIPFTITPAGANELIFAETIWDYNTGSGMLPQGAFFDTNTFDGESQSGPEPVDENNAWGHMLTTGTSPVSITWQVMFGGLPVQNWAGMAVAFKPAP